MGERAPPTLPSLMVPLRDPSEAFQRNGTSDVSPSPMTKLYFSHFFDDHHHREEPEAKYEPFSHTLSEPMSNESPIENSVIESSSTLSPASDYFPTSKSLSIPPTSDSLTMAPSSTVAPITGSSWMRSTSDTSAELPKSESREPDSELRDSTVESSSILARTSESSSIVELASESSSIIEPSIVEPTSESSAKAVPTSESSSIAVPKSESSSLVVVVVPTSEALSSESLSITLGSSLSTRRATALGLKGSVILESGRRSNVARFKTMMPARLPIPRSPFLTIPPGLSPTTLLDSPVLLSINQAEPSPTTGTFPLPQISQSMRLETTPDVIRRSPNEDTASLPFSFSLVPNISKNPQFPLSKLGISQPPKAEPASEPPPIVSVPDLVSFPQTVRQSSGTSVSFWDVSEALSPPQAIQLSENLNVIESCMVSEPVVQSLPFANLQVIEKPSEDGYNWRKYGQKQVKGSEFPRSYYKCTHPNCQVKKKVERAHDGHVTEIIYKGEHNHPKPQSTRRSSSMGANGSGREGLCIVSRKGDGHDHKSEASASRGQMGSAPNGTPEPSLGSISDVEADGEASKVENGDDDDEDDEPDSKRRREGFGEVPSNLPLRTTREPRVVVQTISEVDILDDGYRWRKYGQKIVKGNPHPRSYYKCTNVGCSVRKHVERSSTDRGAVITTYEGKHNHDVPVAKNRHHDHSTSSSSSSGPSSSLALPQPHSSSTVIAHYADSNAIPRTLSHCLQDQYLVMSRMGEDRLKADGSDGQMMLMELDRDRSRSLIQAPSSFGNCMMDGGSLQGSENTKRGSLIRPEEQQTGGSNSSWPSTFLKSSIIQR